MLLRPLLLLPLLTPLLAVLLVAAINPRPQVSLRLLTWRSPSLPIGVWIAGAAAGGAAISASASALALRETKGRLRRQVRRTEPLDGFAGDGFREHGAWRESEPPRSQRGGERREPVRGESGSESVPWGASVPVRGPGEPAPTVAVPFRVIRRASASAGASPQAGEGIPAGGTAAQAAAQAAARAPAWAAAAPLAREDDWDAPANQEW